MAAETQAQTKSDYRQFLVKYEGYTNKPKISGYPSVKAEITVGIGHNLAGEKPIKDKYSDEEVNEFFDRDLKIALAAARQNIRNFDNQPANCKLIIVSLIFTCGPQGFERFSKFRLAIENKNYKVAAQELKNSKWWEQVGENRRKDHYKMLFNLN